MTIEQAQKLKRAIRVLVRAEIANSWIGANPVCDHEIIKSELISARIRVAVIIGQLVEKDS